MKKEMIRRLREIGTSYRQIARRLGIPENTVKSICRHENIFNLKLQQPIPRCRCCNALLSSTRRHYCSDSCRYRWNYQHRILGSKNAVRLVCKNCGKPFYSYPSCHRVYCSHKCYIEDRYGERNLEYDTSMD